MRLKNIIPSLRLISIQNIMFCLLWLLLTFSIVWFRPNITSLVVYFLLLKKSMFQVESSSFLGQLKEFFWYLVAPSSVYFHSTHLLDISLSLSLSIFAKINFLVNVGLLINNTFLLQWTHLANSKFFSYLWGKHIVSRLYPFP